jgi:hypothetical protein
MNKLTKDQQLNLIEGICLLYQDGVPSKERAEKFIESIYKIAHLNGTCENKHEDWHKEGLALGEALNGYIDFNKIRRE